MFDNIRNAELHLLVDVLNRLDLHEADPEDALDTDLVQVVARLRDSAECEWQSREEAAIS
jgi:hypothetical protein